MRLLECQSMGLGVTLLVVALLAQALCLGATNEAAFTKTTSANHSDEYEARGRKRVAECPDCAEGYEDLMRAIQFGERKKAKGLAQEIMDGPAPEKFKSWARGFVRRVDAFGQPVDVQFVALDGRKVSTSKLRGKVVLIDFWATTCEPSMAAQPDIKAAYSKYHAQGFEVVGISLDTDRSRLTKFVKDAGLAWPQCFEGKRGVDNKLAQEFGVWAIPHTMLLDKKGCLRLASTTFDSSKLAPHVSKLLSEQ